MFEEIKVIGRGAFGKVSVSMEGGGGYVGSVRHEVTAQVHLDHTHTHTHTQSHTHTHTHTHTHSHARIGIPRSTAGCGGPVRHEVTAQVRRARTRPDCPR